MKADIVDDGKMEISPETDTEAFALRKWHKENRGVEFRLHIDNVPIYTGCFHKDFINDV